MKFKFFFLLMVQSLSAFAIDLTLEEAKNDFGNYIVYAQTTHSQSLYWEDHKISIVTFNHKPFQYVSRNPSFLKTDLGISVGDSFSKIKELYGPFNKTTEVDRWFEGSDANTLYHYVKNGFYKIALPKENTYLLLTPEKEVYSITITKLSQ